MRFTCAAGTDKGVVRHANEDSHLMQMDRGIFIVADGMGGHAAGEVAAEMAVQIIAETMGSFRGLPDAEVAARLFQAVQAANGAIYRRTLVEKDKRGMGTTVTGMLLFPHRYLIVQVGDSRAYILRRGRLLQVTKDHSYVQEQVDAGLLTPEQARTHPYSNVITRCVGSNEEVVPDLYFGALEEGDVILLASDGLTGMLEDDVLARIMETGGEPRQWVDRMIADANRRGGLDNITVVVVRIDSMNSTGG
jgi:serine/threonine protein phosphatase PrpC